ncbi:MAG: preprotein translocase subunit YajC [Candidatus Eisenbacteria bacterium]|uniref:Preprotein translocase subunit YajC n=1 Tax=Eiseniibacteriota bacterium TaxID=2212470 RepID=A0A538TMD2_UNCEI|nr:MAG: preprotein translocase subunit YajC [Candidatus Eisenbacteria bacterium]
MVQAAFAQAPAPVAAAPSQPDQMLHMFAILAITIGIFYFMIIRPQQKKQKETEAMLQAISKGDRVLTTGGVLGTVVGTKTDDVVVLKVADDVKMEFSKQSIVRVLERGE